MLDVAFAAPALPADGTLVLLATEDAAVTATPLGAALDASSEGALSRAVAAAEFTGKRGSTAALFGVGPLSRVLLVGLGKTADRTARHLEEAGGTLAAALTRAPRAVVGGAALDGPQAAALALGARLRTYRFDRYRTQQKPEDRPRLAELLVLTDAPGEAESAWTAARAVADGVCLARDLVSEPPNVLHPAELARRCQELSGLGLAVEVMGPDALRAAGMGLLLGVAQGSAQEPRVVTLTWSGGTAGEPPLAFVGKGVTFDTGGISIKPAGGMEDMKFDMAGAAAVIGLMAALAGRRARVNAVGLVGLVENMPGPNAQRPGDVVTSASGQTVEIINTDAEGRLVLADVLHHCRVTHAPRFMIDLATLTGAMIVSLGHERAGFFATDDAMATALVDAGEATGDRLWRMPLGEDYDKLIKSDIADMKNVGARPGGAISAAQFIKRFTADTPWAHLDIAGTAWTTRDHPCTPKGATGYGVRVLDRFVAETYER